MKKEIIKEFPVTVYGNLIQYSETISKARCRIFYKYANRNGTYITDQFAEKLLKTIPYTPIKGIYNELNEDYEDHGEKRDSGNIYGVVPENPNLQWELHLDEDGVERNYACVDVLLFTALYEESDIIVGKAQSMELYPPSIKGEWKFIGGKRRYEYSDGCFLGLQVLGEEVEPCFEGAAFFELYNSLKQLFSEIEEYNMELPNFKKGGQPQMPKINFKLSDAEKYQALWSLLNVNFNEAGGWYIEYAITEVYDDYAIAYNYENEHYERVYYLKDDSADEVSLTGKEKVFIIDVTESEKKSLETIRALNGDTYEAIEEIFEQKSELEKENSTYEQKVKELDESLATLKTEGEQFTTKLEEANATISDLTEEVNTLNSYKENVETKEKEDVISSYAELLSEDILETYAGKISEYSVIELDKELAYELKKSNVSIFSKDNATPRTPQETPKEGIEGILSRYKK